MGHVKQTNGGYLTETTGLLILAALGGGSNTADQFLLHDFEATPVDLVYTAIGGASTIATTEMDIFNSAGEPIILGIDPAGGTAFVDAYQIAPGGNGLIKLEVSTVGSTFAVKRQAVTGGASINAGFIQINVMG